MKRKIYNELLEWKQKYSTKEALLIEGARRIGKSYIVEEFARNEYRSYMLIDFSKVSKEVKEIFDNYLTDEKMLFRLLSLQLGVKLYPRESLIIFDEVQKYPYYTNPDKEDASERMEIDFLIRKSTITSKHNICPVEVKSTQRYTTSSLDKFHDKFKSFLHTSYVVHSGDLKTENGIVYLPLYMAPML